MPVQPVPESHRKRLHVSIRKAHERRTMADEADEALRRIVASAREAGASWAAIGGALGITRQAAQQRYR